MSTARRATIVADTLLVAALSSGCAAWKRFQSEGFGRDSWQKPEEVTAWLGLSGAGDRLAVRHDLFERQSFQIFEPDDETGE
jgi:hypothetical protein